MQIAPETCRANDERNKEYSVHLVGPELNIYYQDVRNHKHHTELYHTGNTFSFHETFPEEPYAFSHNAVPGPANTHRQ
jgi:hypothetical protein